MMRCKNHPSDHTSSIGVCATCLRHRLAILAAFQDHHDCQNPSTDSRFFHTPQIEFPKKLLQSRSSGFSFFSKLFRSKSVAGHKKMCSDRGMSPNRVPELSHSKTGVNLPRNVSGFGFCLSPMVRPSPGSRQWRNQAEPKLVTCRSRKLCDLGRVHRNR